MRTNKIIEAIHEGRLDERLTEIYADPILFRMRKSVMSRHFTKCHVRCG